MTTPLASTTRTLAYHGVSWEDAFGYAQAVQVGSTVYISGQLSHDASGALIAPAPLENAGRPRDFGMMERQMERTYQNAASILAQFGASLDDVVQETLYVLDVDAAFAVAGAVRRRAYGVDRPRVASNLIGVSRLAFPEQLIEIVLQAEIGAR